MRNGVRVGILGLIVAAAIRPGVAVAADFTVTTTADGDDKVIVRAGKKYVARAR